jgi:hypothetical protein
MVSTMQEPTCEIDSAHNQRHVSLSHTVSDSMRTTKQERHVGDYPAFWTLRILCSYLSSGYLGLAKGCVKEALIAADGVPYQYKAEQRTSLRWSALLETEDSRHRVWEVPFWKMKGADA